MIPYAYFEYGLVATGVVLLFGAFYRACRAKPEHSLPMLDSNLAAKGKKSGHTDAHSPASENADAAAPGWSPKPTGVWEEEEPPKVRAGLLAKTEKMPVFHYARTPIRPSAN